MDSGSFRDRLRGLGWFVAACQVAAQVISIGVLVILYPRLGPYSFGVLAMALPAVTLGRLVAGFGLSTAGVASAALDEEAQAGLFWYGLGWSVLVAAATSLSGFALARFFAEPVLIQVVPALAITMIFSAGGLLHQVRLERAMRLSAVAAIRLVALTLGGAAALVVAGLGGGIWALVAQQLVEWAALTAGFWIAEPWKPRLIRPNAASLRAVRQGGAFTASSLAVWLAQNVDTLVVGRWGGAWQLGLYSQAYNLVMKPVLLVTTPLTAVMLPTLARVAHSPAEYRRLVGGFFRIVGILLFPCGLGLLVLPVNIMELLGGNLWAEGEWTLRVLAPLILIQGFLNICASVFASLSRFDRLLRGALAYAAAISAAVLVGAWWGAPGPFSTSSAITENVALAVTMATAFFLLPYLRYCLRTVPIAGRAIGRAIWTSAVASVGMAFGVWSVAALSTALSAARLSPWLLAGVSIMTGIVCYLIFARAEIRWLIRGTDNHQ